MAGIKNPPPLAGGGFFEEIWILENQLLFTPPRKAGAQTAKWAFIERVLVSGRFASMVEERFIKDAKYLGGEPGEVKCLFVDRRAKGSPSCGSSAPIHEMKVLAAIGLALAMLSPVLFAGDSILPKGWEPSTTDATDYLQQALQDEKAQQGINRLTGHIAAVLDAQLLVSYVKLYERLDQKGKASLKEDQTQWLAKRQKIAKAAASSEEGGSASSMEANTAFADFTTKRLTALNTRLKKLPSQTKAR